VLTTPLCSLSLSRSRSRGCVLAGQAEGYGVELDGWHKAVHGTLDYAELLPKNPPLKDLLDSLDMPKYIFTNADRIHAEVCLDHIGIRDCFVDIIAFDDIVEHVKKETGATGPELMKSVFCKPDARAFEYAMKRANAEAGSTMFLDDSTANIKGAKEVGLQTVLVGSKDLCEGADYAVENFLHLKDAAPSLWQ